MIENEQQYQVTKEQCEKFGEAVKNLSWSKSQIDIHPRLQQACYDALVSMRDELQEQLDEYHSKRKED